MMGRGIWFGAGVAAGVYGVVRVRRVLEAFTVDGMRDRVGAAFVGARMFREELEQGRVHAEADLRERYRLASAGADGPGELTAAPHPTPALARPNEAPERGND
ncbi:hypothetical protein E8D34_16815 [Nocardioides sp. GY 10113]|uniref:DUF6167 family protein n=1 Tax=Nocardioides sp. GY 10113 TaxID=2569761 RepID=UPI0010A86D8D|nr:DUF6167 family protein [Nocardioides sp. GY 10113]TIC80360.1 hypothetical protein E8D34_19165 [Nocardioides sp. GY 10113]TIC82479.1 hypothetical protein E8D34_16815 [Nocardioides sp. GY 10113]